MLARIITFHALTQLFCVEAYIYRDINKPIIQLKENYIIQQLGPYRTGSTLIYNILKYLFEDKAISGLESYKHKVVKFHQYPIGFYRHLKMKNIKPFIVITIRHPLNSAASIINIDENIDLYHLRDQYTSIYDNTINLFDPNDFICLFYEDFENNFHYIFNKIEAFFKVKIPKKEKRFILKTFNKNVVQKHIKHLNGHNEWHPQTHFHGNHISNSSFTRIKDVNLKQDLRDLLSKSMHIWGYADIPDSQERHY